MTFKLSETLTLLHYMTLITCNLLFHAHRSEHVARSHTGKADKQLHRLFLGEIPTEACLIPKSHFLVKINTEAFYHVTGTILYENKKIRKIKGNVEESLVWLFCKENWSFLKTVWV